MTTTLPTPARRLSLIQRAVIAIALALGITATALPAQEAAAAPTLTYTVYGHTVTAPNWGSKVAVWTALGQRGDPYVYGAEGPSSFDCSGLTSYSWKKAGISIPRTSRSQSTYGRAVSKSALRAGDLVFFYSPVSHVALYIGAGYIVHAPSRGDVVRTTKLAYMSSYAGARRPY
jgi:cell wall-associated NlpC family hydrolase